MTTYELRASDPPSPPAGFTPAGFLVWLRVTPSHGHPRTAALAAALVILAQEGIKTAALYAIADREAAGRKTRVGCALDPESGRWGEWQEFPAAG